MDEGPAGESPGRALSSRGRSAYFTMASTEPEVTGW